MGGFIRRPAIVSLQLLATMPVGDPAIRDLCGTYGDKMFFSTTDITRLVTTDRKLGFRQTFLTGPDTSLPLSKMRHFEYFVDKDSVWLFLGNVPAIYSGSLENQLKSLGYSGKKFSRVIFGSDHTAIIRGFDSSGDNQVLYRWRKNGDKLVSDTILARHGDGGLCSDGLLSFDPDVKLITYSYFYCNLISVFDTGLVPKLYFRTIDTFSQFQATAQRVKNGYTFTRPTRTVNAYSCAAGGLLYVNSLVEADNQSERAFSRNATVDVYNLSSGQYTYSFYIPKIEGRAMVRFKVTGKIFVAIFPDSVRAYSLL